MVTKASDLADAEKRRLLDVVRQQIGSDRYDELRLQLQYDDDRLLDLALTAAQQSVDGSSKGADEAPPWGCFVVAWLAVTVGVGIAFGASPALFFCLSPVLYILFYGAPYIPDALSEHIPRGCAWTIVVIIYGALILIAAQLPKDAADNLFIAAMGGGIAAAAVWWLVRGVLRLGGQ